MNWPAFGMNEPAFGISGPAFGISGPAYEMSGPRWHNLKQKHGIPKRIEPVFFPDSMSVDAMHFIQTRESSDHHEQGALWQMEVGNEGINGPEPVTGCDEDIGVLFAGCEVSKTDFV